MVAVVLVDDGLALLHDLGLQVRWHRLVVGKLHRELPFTGRDRPQLR